MFKNQVSARILLAGLKGTGKGEVEI